MEERFTTITYSDEKLFTKSENKISLKEWTENLLFLVNFESNLDANYSTDLNTEILGSTSLLQNFNPFGFGKSLELVDSIAYSKNNFLDLTDKGTVSFRIRPKNNNAPGVQYFNRITLPTISVDSTYQFEVLVSGVSDGIYEITVEVGETFATLKSKISGLISSNIGAVHAFAENLTTNQIGVQSTANGNSIEIIDVDGEPSFIDFMQGVGTSLMLSPPSANVTLFEFYDGTSDFDRVQIIHETVTSNLLIKVYNNIGVLIVDQILMPWNNHSMTWNEFNLSWVNNTIYFFFDGTLKKVILLDVWNKLTTWNARMQFNASATDPYFISEVIAYNDVYSYANYTPRTTPILRYFSDAVVKPYIEFNFGKGFKQNEITGLNIVGTPGLKFVVKNNNAWQYYVGGAWRNSDATFVQANEPDILELKFVELSLDESTDLIFRVYFDSDGSLGVYIDDLFITRVIGSAEPAILVGSIELNSTVDLSTNNEITIKTDQGTTVVDLTTNAADATAVTAQEIIDAINTAAVPGLEEAVLDPYNKIVLKTSTTGAAATLDVYEGSATNAVPIVWGFANSDIGADSTIDTMLDFSQLYDYVRRKLGGPIMPVELTEEHLADALMDAMAEYKRWRNFKVDMIYAVLDGNSRDGYDIPPVVGGEENIVEVVVRPVLPWSYYAGRDDLIGNMYVQSFFNRKGVMEGATDYYLTIQANNDLNILMNQNPKITYMNRKIFIHPRPPASFHVAIRFKSPMTIDEIFNSDYIRRLMVAEAKITLGTIRTTFGNTIPGGEQMLQLNGDALISAGKEERQAVVEEMKRSTEIYEFIFG